MARARLPETTAGLNLTSSASNGAASASITASTSAATGGASVAFVSVFRILGLLSGYDLGLFSPYFLMIAGSDDLYMSEGTIAGVPWPSRPCERRSHGRDGRGTP